MMKRKLTNINLRDNIYDTWPDEIQREKIKEYQDGKRINKELRKEIINHNLKFVMYLLFTDRLFCKFIAKVEMEEIFNVGVIALINALDHYDYNKNVKFTTFAERYITNYMIDYRNENSVSNVKLKSKDGRIINLVYGMMNQGFTLDEIYNSPNFNFFKTKQGFHNFIDLVIPLFNGVPLEKHFDSDDDDNSYDSKLNLSSYNLEDSVIKKIDDELLYDLIWKKIYNDERIFKSEKDRDIFKYRIVNQYSLRKIGALINVSRQTVLNKYNNIINKIKLLYGKELKLFLA